MLDEVIIKLTKENKLPKRSGIYAIRNLVNNKIYIGSSNNIRKRNGYHFSALRIGKHKNPHLQSAYLKYGENNLLFFILEFCETDKLEEREQFYIDRFDAANRLIGYNIRHLVSLNATCSDETKLKISIGKIIRYRNNPPEKCKRGHYYTNSDGTSNRNSNNGCKTCAYINGVNLAEKRKKKELTKSYCKNGHLWADNEKISKNGSRCCKQCMGRPRAINVLGKEV